MTETNNTNTIEHLKSRRLDFINTINKYKEYKDELNKRDDIWKTIFSECRPFDDFSWRMFEFSIENWVAEFFHNYLDENTIKEEMLYYIYELEWGHKSHFYKSEEKDKYDIEFNGHKFNLYSEEALWNYLIFIIENPTN